MGGAFADLGGRGADDAPLPPIRPHGKLCTPICDELSRPSHLVRDRPPMVRCDYCGAPPGIACHLPSRPRFGLRVFGRNHPSRLEAA